MSVRIVARVSAVPNVGMPLKRLVLLPFVLLLAACGTSAGSGGSSTEAASGATSTAAAAPTTTGASSTDAATTTTTTTTATTATASTPAASPPCRAADLSLSFLGQQGGMGHGEIAFRLRNTSDQSCRTYGYPGILFLDRRGGSLPTIPHHTTRDFFGSSPATPLLIAPHQSASFRLDVGHGIATANGCTTAYGLQVIPPNDTAALRTTIPDGAYECRDANVSPLRAGTSAYP
jgi:hypothetical protein